MSHLLVSLFACPNPGVTGWLYLSAQALLASGIKTNLLKVRELFPKLQWRLCTDKNFTLYFANSAPACLPSPLLFSPCNNTVCL